MKKILAILVIAALSQSILGMDTLVKQARQEYKDAIKNRDACVRNKCGSFKYIAVVSPQIEAQKVKDFVGCIDGTGQGMLGKINVCKKQMDDVVAAYKKLDRLEVLQKNRKDISFESIKIKKKFPKL